MREEVQKQALDLAVNNNRCGLGISMGVGKTRIAIQHLQKNYYSLVVLFKRRAQSIQIKLKNQLQVILWKSRDKEEFQLQPQF